MTEKLSCFKAYDIRGKIPEDLNEEMAYQIGLAYSKIINPGTIIVGYDVRLESPMITRSVIKGLLDSGTNVINIGVCGTEEVYFHAFNREQDGIGGGIMVTASHNPKGHNGMKMVKSGSRPMSGADDLQDIHDIVVSIRDKKIDAESLIATNKGREITEEDKSEYIKHILGYIKTDNLKPLKIVVNPGNGPAGSIIKLLEEHLPCEFVYIHENPDGNFPNGVPNPMIIENRVSTSEAVIKHKADMGIAWDGDFDRCFLFDEKGDFIEGYYIVGLLAASFLAKNPGAKIIHDPRLIWDTIDIVQNAGGIAVQSKSGHSFIKKKMRQEDAVYGGEMSAHHYFKDFAYCDSGMLPWLLIAEHIVVSNTSLSKLVEQRIEAYPCSGEINYRVQNVNDSIQKVKEHFLPQNPKFDYIDGVSIEFPEYRFNLRGSNTEPLLRLNLETKGNNVSIKEKIAEIESVLL